ncbi:MAG: aminotransferase class IV [Flavobacteriaceae bacterium]
MINFDGNCFSDFKAAPEKLLYALTFLPIHTHHLIAFNGKITLLEANYFSIMAALRRSRVEIPMEYTLEFFQEQLDLLNNFNNTHVDFQKVIITFYRKQNSTRDVKVTSICYLIQIEEVFWHGRALEMTLYKDHYIFANDYSNRFQTNESLRNLAKVFAYENGFGVALLLNDQKRLVESTHGSVFLIEQETIQTPALSEGAIDDVLRKAFIGFLINELKYKLIEAEITVFSIQEAQEIFLISPENGFVHINQFRKKKFEIKKSKMLREAFFDYLSNQL